MKIIITLPAYDEEESIGETLEDIKDAMANTGYEYILHVVPA